jgi:hypothetical protein
MSCGEGARAGHKTQDLIRSQIVSLPAILHHWESLDRKGVGPSNRDRDTLLDALENTELQVPLQKWPWPLVREWTPPHPCLFENSAEPQMRQVSHETSWF